MVNEPNKVIYSMIGVSKYYDKKPVLKDIYLSYFYGAKTGVIGLNRAGKSSLLKIIAGVDKEFNGETVIAPGYSVGYLEQDPRLDESKTVLEIVQEGVQETVNLLNEFNRISDRFSEPLSAEEMDQLIAKQGALQEKINALDAWDLDARLKWPWMLCAALRATRR
jgi:ATPase subunit of ABC transporter with duplicated ATPase domains